MFGLGIGEIAVIALVALIFIKPDKLPGVLRQAGKISGRLQRLAGSFREEMEKNHDYPEKNNQGKLH